MKQIGIFVIGLIATTPVFAQTSPLSYDYVEANFGTGDILDEDFSFYGAAISYSINESVFLQGSYSDGETDDDIAFVGGGSRLAQSKFEMSGYDLGIGFHTTVGDATDFVMSASYISVEIENFPSYDERPPLNAPQLGIRGITPIGLSNGVNRSPYTLPIFGVGEWSGFSDDDEEGYSIDAGFRFKPIEQVELNVFADYEDIGGKSETGYSASAYYFFTPGFSLGGIYARADDVDSIAASVRFHF